MYVLTTAKGYQMKFYLESIAKLYRNIYGGQYVYEESVQRDVEYTESVIDWKKKIFRRSGYIK